MSEEWSLLLPIEANNLLWLQRSQALAAYETDSEEEVHSYKPKDSVYIFCAVA